MQTDSNSTSSSSNNNNDNDKQRVEISFTEEVKKVWDWQSVPLITKANNNNNNNSDSDNSDNSNELSASDFEFALHVALFFISKDKIVRAYKLMDKVKDIINKEQKICFCLSSQFQVCSRTNEKEEETTDASQSEHVQPESASTSEEDNNNNATATINNDNDNNNNSTAPNNTDSNNNNNDDDADDVTKEKKEEIAEIAHQVAETPFNDIFNILCSYKYDFLELYIQANNVFDIHHHIHPDNRHEWELCKDAAGVQTYYKQRPNSDFHYIMMQGTIPTNCFDVIVLVNEIDLFGEWISMISESNIALDLTMFKKVVHLKFRAPFAIRLVVSDRELVMKAAGVDMLEQNQFIAICTSLDDDELQKLEEAYGKQPNSLCPRSPAHVRMDCHLAGLVIEPVDSSTTKLTVITSVDPKIMLPTWVLNVATRQVSHKMLEMLSLQAQQLGKNKVYQEKIAQRKEMYDEIKQRIAEFEQKKKDNNNNNDNANDNDTNSNNDVKSE